MSKKLIYLVSFVLVLVLTSNAFTAEDPSLVIYYSFDDVGEIVADQSGKGHDGTVQGDVTAEPNGKCNGAAKFANGGYLDLDGPNFPAEDIPTSAMTLAAWIKCENTGGHHEIFNARASDNTWLIHPEPRSSGDIRWLLRSYGGTTIFQIRAGTVTWDEWLHFAGTYDKASGKAALYINGELIEEIDVASPADIAGDWDQGARVGLTIDNARPFTGLMDEFCMFTRALLQAEIKSIMQGGGIGYSYAFGPDPANGTLHPDTWANLSWYPGDTAVSHDVYFGDNFDDVKDGTGDTFRGNQALTSTTFFVGFFGYPYPDGLVPGTTYYWRIDEVNDTEPNSPWKGDVWSFMVPPKTAYDPDPADGAEFIDPNVELNWTAGFGAKMHTVYFGDNFDDVNNATGGDSQGATTYTPGTLESEKVYYWRVDEYDAIDTYKGDVWSFTTPGAVGSPNPSNGATGVNMTATLSWKQGDSAASHEVYLGTDKDAVRNADTASPEYYKGTRNLGSESYYPGKLAWYTTYYWRVDEVNNVNPDSPWQGPVWSFTTADFIVVDDFESYNDLDPNDPGSNRIFNTWQDGYNDPTNGSQVGYLVSPLVETTIVHGGSQSMPYFYDNDFKFSEAELPLSPPQDWTEEGVGVLSLWFYGDASNAAESMYVALNGSAAVYHDDPNAAQINTWTEWTIDLQAFTGVNLTNVNSIALGFGDKNNPQAGGSGKVYFDDIRLYRPKPAERVIFLFDDFEGYADDTGLTAAGWTILDTPTATEDSTWTITNPGGRANPPTLDGSASTGNFMISDSDTQSISGDQDNGASHDLYTPSFSTLGGSTVWLHVDVSAQLNNNGTAIFDVEVSTDGETWTNVFSCVSPGRGTSEPTTTRLPDNTNADGYFGRLDLDLSDVAADNAAVQVRFRHYEPDWDWWIAIDNVLVDDVAAPQGGSITVFSEDFSNGLGQMEVFSGQGNTGTETWHTTDKGGRYVPGTVQEQGVNRLGPHPGATRDFAIIDSDTDPDPAEDEWLMTPTLDLSGMTEVFLHYESETVMSSGVWNQEVLVSLDGGSTFETTPIFAYTGGGLFDNGEEPVFAERIFDVSAIAAGESQVVFAFRYTGDGDDWWWAIDNVEVSGIPR